MKGREFVLGEDIAWLAPYVFAHRISLAPGVDDDIGVVAECVKGPLEVLSRFTLAKK